MENCRKIINLQYTLIKKKNVEKFVITTEFSASRHDITFNAFYVLLNERYTIHDTISM